jgi:hypothetical protein
MNFIERVLVGLAIAAVGLFFTIKTSSIVDMFGSVDWAEQKLGGGGTNLFYKLLGIAVTLIGFIVATNFWNALLEATLGSILPKGS